MVLSEIIPQVGLAWGPVEVELTLLYMVTQPVETHVNGASTLLLAGSIYNSMGHGIVGLEWGGQLGVT
jgi:hypothetical protein